MKTLTATVLAIGLVAAAGAAPAQTYSNPRAAYGTQEHHDWARVVRVQPVYDNRGGYANAGTRCVESRTYGGGYDDRYDRGYRDGGYRDVYSRDGYYRDGYARDGYRDRYDPYAGGYGRAGTQAGGTVATVIGGIVGAAVGSQMGGGSARYATSAIGSMVGGMAGRQIYEHNQRNRQPARVGVAVACDPVPVGSYGGAQGTMYDVTYEYAGRMYDTRTSYHPGDRIRVRVDVRAD